MKLTEERIREILNNQIDWPNQESDKAASAIYSAHQEEMKELKEQRRLRLTITDCWQLWAKEDVTEDMEDARYVADLPSMKIVVSARTRKQAFKEVITSFAVMIAYDSGMSAAELSELYPSDKSLEKENAQLKQSQKDFAKFVREQVDNYKVPKEDWERIRNMNWDELYEYWKTINKNV